MAIEQKRIEAAARALEAFDHEGRCRLFTAETFDGWESAAGAILAAGFPELASDPPTGWVAPMVASDKMAIQAEGYTDFYLDKAIADTPARRLNEWRLAYSLMRDAHIKEQGE